MFKCVEASGYCYAQDFTIRSSFTKRAIYRGCHSAADLVSLAELKLIVNTAMPAREGTAWSFCTYISHSYCLQAENIMLKC